MAIEVQIVSNSGAAQKDMENLRASVDKISTTVNSATQQFKNMAVAIGATLVSFQTAKLLAETTDQLTRMATRMKLVTATQEEYNTALGNTRKIAMNTRQSLESVVNLYAKLAMSSSQLGVTQRQIATVTQSVSKAMTVSGASTSEATSAIMQLGQALGSGRLQGDELRSITENAYYLANQIAKGLGMSVGQMRLLGAEGKLTSKTVFAAILKQSAEINENFDKVGLTFAAAATNLKTAFVYLFDTIVHGKGNTSNNSVATLLNDMAIAVYNFAETMDAKLLKARMTFWSFIADIREGLKGLSITTGSTLSTIVDNLIKGSVASATAGFGTLGGIIREALGGLTSGSLTLDIRSIKLADFLPRLDAMAVLVKRWAVVVERAFFWVYDRVIGHSWIPDLVEGVISWMKKLGGAPLESVKSFAGAVSDVFSELFKKLANVPFIKNMIDSIKTLKKQLEESSFVRNLKQAFGIAETVPGTYSDRTSESGSKAYGLKKDGANVGRGPWRFYGAADRPLLHDTTNAFKSENKIPYIATLTTALIAGFVTLFSTGSVVTAVAATFGAGIFTGMSGALSSLLPTFIFIGSAIATAFSSNPVVKILAALATTGFGLKVGTLVDDKEIGKTTEGIVATFVKGVDLAVAALFGSGIFGERGFGGTLTLIAKLSLMFAAGRAFLGGVAMTVLKGPSSIVDTLQQDAERRMLDRRVTRDTAAIDGLPQALLRRQADAMQRIAAAETRLAASTDKNGNRLGQSGLANLQAAMTNGARDFKTALSSLSSSARTAAVQLATTNRSLTTVRGAMDALPRTDAAARANIATMAAQSAALRERINATKESAKGAVLNTAMGVGAIFGGLGGYNLGGVIAKQMELAEGWPTIGAKMMGGLLGQGLGAGIGAAIGHSFLAVVGVLGTLIASPLFLVVAGIGLAIAAALNWDKVKPVVEQAVSFLINTFIPAFISACDGFIKAFRDVTKIDTWLDKVTKPIAAAYVALKNGTTVRPPETPEARASRLAELPLAERTIEVGAGNLGAIRGIVLDIGEAVATALSGTANAAESAAHGLKTLSDPKTLIPLANGAIAQIKEFAEPTTVPDMSAIMSNGDVITATVTKSVEQKETSFVDRVLDKHNDLMSWLQKQAVSAGQNVSHAITGDTPNVTNVGDIGRAATAKIADVAANANASIAKTSADAKEVFTSFSTKVITEGGKRVSVATTASEQNFLKLVAAIRTVESGTVRGDRDNVAGPKIRDKDGNVKQYKGRDAQAMGSMQIIERTFDGVIANHPDMQNIGLSFEKEADRVAVSIRLLQDLMVKWKGDIQKVAAEYNGGPGAITASGELHQTWGFGEGASKAFTKDYEAKVSELVNGTEDELVELAKQLPSAGGMVSGIASISSKIKTGISASVRKTGEFQEGLVEMLRPLIDVFGKLAGKTDEQIEKWIIAAKEVNTVKGFAELLGIMSKEGPSTTAIKEAFKKRIERTTSEIAALDMINEQFRGIDAKELSAEAYRKLTVAQKDEIVDYITSMETYFAQAGNGVTYLDEKLRALGVELQGKLRKIAKDSAIPAKLKNPPIFGEPSEYAQKAGAEAATRFTDEVSTGFAKWMKGQETFKGTVEALIDSFTSSVIDGFAKSLTKGLFGEKGIFEGLLVGNSNFGESIGKYVRSFFVTTKQNEGSDIASPKLSGQSVLGINVAKLLGEEKTNSTQRTISSSGNSVWDAKLNEGLSSTFDKFNTQASLSFGGINAGIDSIGAKTTETLTESTGFFSGEMGRAIKSISEGLGGIFSGILNLFKDIWSRLSGSTGSSGGASGGFLSSAWSGISTLFSGASSWLSAIFAAEGGPIYGPGTGTSDSIPAMLSNGEFVVRASRASQFRPLLHAINSGSISAFATGGDVGAIASMPTSMFSGSGRPGKSTQVFNINVTGDISRQTRTEIQKMIPTIAVGVNSHNHETGTSRR
jgi:tape measure domain-containing protein